MVRIQSWFSSSSLKMASAAFALAFFFCACAGAQVVQTYDFEDGTTQGWQAFIGTAPVNSTAAAYSGTHSLLTSTSSGGAGGPSIPVTTVLQAGAKYTITGWVMLTSGEAATNANFTMRRSDPTCSGGTCYADCANSCIAVRTDVNPCPSPRFCAPALGVCKIIPIRCSSANDCPVYLPPLDDGGSAAWACDAGICSYPGTDYATH